jgi:hypothetical protein
VDGSVGDADVVVILGDGLPNFPFETCFQGACAVFCLFPASTNRMGPVEEFQSRRHS